MTSRDFVYWLQGYFEIMDPNGSTAFPLGPVQTECIRKHLQLVFKHEIAPPKVTVIPPQHHEPMSADAKAQWQKLMQSTRPVENQWTLADPTQATFC